MPHPHSIVRQAAFAGAKISKSVSWFHGNAALPQTPWYEPTIEA
jgi:hypothetical protein